MGRLLDTRVNGSRNGEWISLKYSDAKKKIDSTFEIKIVKGSLFHDVFSVVRKYLPNGELVDLHDNYDNCKCFLTNDGLSGFAIEPDGNLVSVFSLQPRSKKGFLYAIKDFVREQGATHLDCYLSPNQNLEEIYKKTLDFHTASTMDYNMDYGHDDIAENHGSPRIGFMVSEPVAEYKHFNKDQYEEAYNHAQSQIKQSHTQQQEYLPTEEPEDVQQVRNTLATNAVLSALDKAGVKVVHATQDMVDAVLEKSGVELNAKRKSAPETASVTPGGAHQPTVVSSADRVKSKSKLYPCCRCFYIPAILPTLLQFFLKNLQCSFFRRL